MSKIGKKIIEIPTDVSVVVEGKVVKAKGRKGELEFTLPREIEASLKDNQLTIVVAVDSKRTPALWGTARAVISNMIFGVHNGFEKKLEIEGVGYKAQMQGKDLILSLGFSHPIVFKAPEGVTISVEKNSIVVSGPSIESVGQTAANIRALKKPEPYKGKGIRYVGEIIRRKAGKKVAGTTA
ncbi:MAG: 50S ribosomal protein L6 [Parcubacteria group bacterium]|nr:50S ribosomal protein L6 [Parcubacteria group bacterium]